MTTTNLAASRLRHALLLTASALAILPGYALAQYDPHAHHDHAAAIPDNQTPSDAPPVATDSVELEQINIVGRHAPMNLVPSSNTVAEEDIASALISTSDTARLFQNTPGIALQTSGGVSALPVVNGLSADRVRTIVNGMNVTASCANFMNPPLSYFDPRAVKNARLVAGITPVSMGGNSIAGTISVSSADPVFAPPDESVVYGGWLSAFYRSNGDGFGTNAHAFAATGDFSLSYTGAFTRSNNYKDGAGSEVGSSLYKAHNHLLRAAARHENHQFGVDLGWQKIPYQGFVNQRMDMTDNSGFSVNASYAGDFDWGTLEGRLYRHNVRHSMDMLDDKRAIGMGPMPMETRGNDTGANVKATIDTFENQVVRIGGEYHRYRLDDWWPPVPGSMMMGLDEFWNINGGERDRFALFGEVETQWSPAWITQIGARYEYVRTDTGPVMDYNHGTVSPEEAAFNALNRERDDHNIDLTATARYEPSAAHAFEFGVARKTRSPNLYERYAWSTGNMAMSMINWFGDLNGYVGDPDLDPEVAHTLRASFEWHDPAGDGWRVKATGYYTRVQDYINAEWIGIGMDGRAQLRFVNHDAELYGVDLEAAKYLGERHGDWQLRAVFSHVVGKDLDTGGDLYNIMPPNLLLALDHKLGNWSSTIELQAVAGKDRVDAVRLEEETDAYALVNIRTSYTYENIRFDIGIDNLFDEDYTPPLGGLSAILFRETGNEASASKAHGPGRSFNVGMRVEF